MTDDPNPMATRWTLAYAAGLLPNPPKRGEDSTIYVFGCQILAYILSQDEEVYGFIPTRDLEDAKYAAGMAVRSPEISEKALEAMHRISVRITTVLEDRKAEIRKRESTAPLILDRYQPAPSGGRGTKVPVEPTPKNNPPAPVFATPPRNWSF